MEWADPRSLKSAENLQDFSEGGHAATDSAPLRVPIHGSKT